MMSKQTYIFDAIHRDKYLPSTNFYMYNTNIFPKVLNKVRNMINMNEFLSIYFVEYVQM